jgi:anti-sigma regulatory factor (Ser/Thr protein kinase)
MLAVQAKTSALKHPALIYSGLDGFLGAALPFVRTGIDAGEPVFAAVGGTELLALRDAFGDEDDVTLVDTRDWTPHPASRLRALHTYVTQQLDLGARSIRLVGESAWETRPEFNREWARYESALNAVFESYPVCLLCAYDERRLDPSIVAGARITHPSLLDDEHLSANDRYREPAAALSAWTPELEQPPADAPEYVKPSDVWAARAFVAMSASNAGVRSDRLDDLALATTEIISNAVQHGGFLEPRLRVWTTSRLFHVQVDDRGPGVRDPLAGYRPPSMFDDGGGSGLWIARQVVDLVRIVSTDRGTSVRLSIATD